MAEEEQQDAKSTSTEKLLAEAETRRQTEDEAAEESRAEAIESLFLFEVGGLRLATQSAYVESVAEVVESTAVPGCPDYVMGVVSHGEVVLPVVDLVRLLDLPTDGDADPLYRRTLVVRAHRFLVGLVCDRARGLIQVPASALKPPSVLQGARLKRFLNAEIEERDGMIGALDMPAMLRAAAVT